VAGIATIDPATNVGDIMGEPSAHIGEGIFGPTRGGAAPRELLRQAGPVDPGDGGGHHAEPEMVGDRIGIAGLRPGTANFLLDLFGNRLPFSSAPWISVI
jgi:hypothetical protein